MASDMPFIMVRDAIEQHLKTALRDLKEFNITFSKQGNCEAEGVWRINLEYRLTSDHDDDDVRRVALCSVKEGQVVQFEQGKCWVS